MSLDKTGFEKPASNIFKFGKVGDVIQGFLTGSELFEGEFGATTSYEVEATAGWFHNISEGATSKEKTEVVVGETYKFLGKNTFTDDLNKASIGQEVQVEFLEERKSQKNGKNYKYIEARLGNSSKPEPESAEDIPFE